MYRLENWSVAAGTYDAPEFGGSLHGEVFENPRFQDGEKILTSKIADANEDTRVVTTKSGSQYLLGDPNPEYIQWLEDNGHDPLKPFPYFKEVDDLDVH
jgi:hypothetical protein